MNPAAARKAVARASTFGTNFRVAMATYGCEVRFGSDGKIADVIAEDAPTAGSGDFKRVFAFADPNASAALVREWNVDRPKGLTGVVWYRLPIDGDRRNWPWQTLRLVMNGRPGLGRLEIGSAGESLAIDLFVANNGDFPSPLPSQIIGDQMVDAADGTRTYRMETTSPALRFGLQPGVWPWLNPGVKLPVGWMRSEPGSPRMQWKFQP